MIAFFQTILDALSLGSIFALAALGVGLLFGILRLANIAHGDFITAGAYSLIVPFTSVAAASELFIGSWHWTLVIPTVGMIVVIIALLTERFVFRPLRNASAPTLMMASFTVSYILQHIMLLVYGSQARGVNLWYGLTEPIFIAGLRIPMIQLITIGVTAALMIALSLFLKFSRFGIEVRAAAEDFRMAQYLGVRANRVIGVAFAISGILAAVVALLYLPQSGTVSYAWGSPLALYAFVAVVVGGMGSLVGAVVGGFLIGAAITFLQVYLPSDLKPFRDAFAFGFVILALVVRPDGLFPNKSVHKRV
ncbi:MULTISPECIES: branched-chain amino acid ABC transporter permease [Roseobacteraceae]|uniref:branched-chain amino acid ABC transporter permease n=1 Tax=Roseobacteraceae TaxID=2854170 RepID=UPI00080AAD77|nr:MULTISPECIES: branched-chain amino acid ABC transporter permease [Roseobacteraceae]ANT62252.1 branched-chain amino acid ABC transporter permease [Salipiger sp. CCB-MM3]